MNSDKREYWSRLFAATEPSLRRFLRRRVSHAWDIQDLAQEAYTRMLRIDQKTADAISNPQAYLFTVASNLVKEHAVMQRRSASDVDIQQVASVLESPRGSAEDEAERQLRRWRVTQALDRLPPRCRAVLVMQHRDGMSYKEIGERLGVSTNMVKKYVVRALALCRDDLADKD